MPTFCSSRDSPSHSSFAAFVLSLFQMHTRLQIRQTPSPPFDLPSLMTASRPVSSDDRFRSPLLAFFLSPSSSVTVCLWIRHVKAFYSRTHIRLFTEAKGLSSRVFCHTTLLRHSCQWSKGIFGLCLTCFLAKGGSSLFLVLAFDLSTAATFCPPPFPSLSAHDMERVALSRIKVLLSSLAYVCMCVCPAEGLVRQMVAAAAAIIC